MAVNALCTAVRRLTFCKQHNIITRFASTHASGLKPQENAPSILVLSSHQCSPEITAAVPIKFTPGTLNIDFRVPPNVGVNKNIIDLPLRNILSIEDPVQQKHEQTDLPVDGKSLDLPTRENTLEKHAVRLIRIRKKKMKKHKMKKLRKKMKFVWEKQRIKRNLAREKAFKQELLDKVKVAQAFDAKEYVASRLAILTKKRIPYTWRGEILPQAQIEEFIRIKKKREEAKRNKPRLKL